jgi:hypothetical protein
MEIFAFALVVDDEVAEVLTTTSPSKLATNFSQNPTLVEITNLSPQPPVGAIWNGENFNVAENLYPPLSDSYTELDTSVFRIFACIVNNVLIGKTKFPNNMLNQERLYAVLASNPRVIDITDQTIVADINPFNKLGMRVVDDQIVSW